MKLASLKSGRDGALVVVDRDLTRAVDASSIAPTLQAALDDWSRAAPALQDLSDEVNADPKLGTVFDPTTCAAPLPRAYQWADGSAYVNHVELVRKARGAELPESFWTDPLMYQGGSDTLLGPHDDIVVTDEAWGIDCEGEVAIITDDVAMGVTPDSAAAHIKLVMLVNDVSLRNLIPGELAKGFGFFHGKPPTAFSPVAVTPDELGAHWVDHTVALPLEVDINNEPFGRARPDIDQTFTFADLIAHAAKTRPLSAGTIIGSGTVSNKLEGGPGKPVAEGGVGYSCVAEVRSVETIRFGEARTSFLRFGDSVSIDMRYPEGGSVFGRIDQTVRASR